jgi:regulator of ribonuclease activity A
MPIRARARASPDLAMPSADLPATTDLCDAFADRVRVLAPGLRSFGGVGACAGPVRTLKVFEDNSLVRAALELPGDGHVLVIDGGASMRCALVGDQLARLGATHGWSGIVVWGCLRDSAVIATLPLAVFALATHPLKSLKQGRGDRDLPVTFHGVTITPGDWLYADADGVIVSHGPLPRPG